MKSGPPSLLPLFRSDTQGRLLAVLMAEPDRELSLTSLARRARTSPATAGREIDRTEAAGIVRTRRQGNTRLVRVDRSHRLYRPLADLVTATWGVPAIIAEEFADVAGIEEVFIFGSFAARWHGEPGRSPNDVDVLVLGAADRTAVDDAAERAEARLSLPVQVTVRPTAQWQSTDDPFLAGLKDRPLYEVFVMSAGEGVPA